MMKKELNREAFAHKRRMFLLVLFTVLSGAVIIGQAFTIATFVDAVFLQGEAVRDAAWLLALLFALFVARVLLSDLPFRIGIRIAKDVKDGYRKRLAEGMRTSEEARDVTGKRVSLYMDVVDEMDSYFSTYLPQLVQTMIVPVMILVTVFTQNIYSGIIMLVTAPLIPVFMILIGGHSEKKAGVQMAKLQSFSGHFLDTLRGVMTLKLFGRTNVQRGVIKEKSIAFREATMDVLKIAFLSALMLEILATIATAMIAVEVGLRLVFGHLAFQTGFFVLLMAPELYLPLKNLGASFHSGRNSIAAAEKLHGQFEEEGSDVSWGERTFQPVSPPSLDIRDLTYLYPGGKQGIRQISTAIEGPGLFTIAGKSGAGKSTLVNLLAGLMASQDGDILIDGHKRESYTEVSWFNAVGYVSQKPYLFAGTMRSNIVMGSTDKTEEEILEAMHAAGLSEVVGQLPKGLDTATGEQGEGFSGGERQRIALARVLLHRPKLIFFDEPTSGLDVVTERRMNDTIVRLSKEATVITIAHRTSTLKESGRILLLENGRHLAEGSFDDLVTKSEVFRSIVGINEGGEQDA